jgi:hypothetical protein
MRLRAYRQKERRYSRDLHLPYTAAKSLRHAAVLQKDFGVQPVPVGVGTR